ncbi:translation initiation factor IF-2-like [Mustela putorius furo]|uniref:Translation initiation factor IF-2-like n=1 Tax=Mustela putorius furo TaxID=9669 RepID=A0A8U0RUH9_MUSPF|nr:translation initiation factor IF-2-like [Mustela putorius furo]
MHPQELVQPADCPDPHFAVQLGPKPGAPAPWLAAAASVSLEVGLPEACGPGALCAPSFPPSPGRAVPAAPSGEPARSPERRRAGSRAGRRGTDAVRAEVTYCVRAWPPLSPPSLAPPEIVADSAPRPPPSPRSPRSPRPRRPRKTRGRRPRPSATLRARARSRARPSRERGCHAFPAARAVCGRGEPHPARPGLGLARALCPTAAADWPAGAARSGPPPRVTERRPAPRDDGRPAGSPGPPPPPPPPRRPGPREDCRVGAEPSHPGGGEGTPLEQAPKGKGVRTALDKGHVCGVPAFAILFDGNRAQKGIPALWKEPCRSGISQLGTSFPFPSLLEPLPLPCFVCPTLGVALPWTPCSPSSWAQIPGPWEWAVELEVPLGTENFLFLLGNGSQMLGLGLPLILSLGVLVGRGNARKWPFRQIPHSSLESLGEGVAG